MKGEGKGKVIKWEITEKSKLSLDGGSLDKTSRHGSRGSSGSTLNQEFSQEFWLDT